MGSRVWLMYLVLTLAMAAESTTKFHEASWGLAHLGNDVDDDTDSCIGGRCNVEDGTDTLMDSETNIRQLAQRKRYISYGALRANSVPCNRRGRSYYNCQSMRRANPYNRGCSVITHCYRFTG